jgi:endonuclease/exonuclease/phosphatase family metal-dependent hydrolase
MKSWIFLLFFLIMSPINPDEIKVVTFNIRYGAADDGSNSWTYRKKVLFDFIRDENADFLGLQEAMMFQIEDILQACTAYRYVGRTREADSTSGEATPILYKEKMYDLIGQGSLWLSDTPEVPASKSWDSSLPRIFTWAQFRRKKDSRDLIVYNTHFDHLGDTARIESSKLIVDHMIHHFKDRNIILLGDFNALEESAPIRNLTENENLRLLDAYRRLHPERKERDMTFYGWNEHLEGTGGRIDYVFYTGSLEPEEAFVSDYHENDHYPSDHMPVVVTFNW